jgi:hypothetical protein
MRVGDFEHRGKGRRIHSRTLLWRVHELRSKRWPEVDRAPSRPWAAVDSALYPHSAFDVEVLFLFNIPECNAVLVSSDLPFCPVTGGSLTVQRTQKEFSCDKVSKKGDSTKRRHIYQSSDRKREPGDASPGILEPRLDGPAIFVIFLYGRTIVITLRW